jgi:hypothetical protein
LLSHLDAILAKHLRLFSADASLMITRGYHANIRQGGSEIIERVQKQLNEYSEVLGRIEQIDYFRLVIRKGSDCLTQPAIRKTKGMNVENEGFRNLTVASYSYIQT